MIKYFEGQKERLIDAIGGKEKSVLDSSFNPNTELSIGKLLLSPMLQQFMVQAGTDAMSLAGSTYNFVWGSELARSLDNRANYFLQEINNTTFKKLKDEFDISLSSGESRNVLIQRIEDVYDDISKGRAKVIARTEVHMAVNNATMAGYKQAAMPIKIWVSIKDLNSRDVHAAMDGEERPIDMPFSNGLMFPGDPNAPASEVINCRCQI